MPGLSFCYWIVSGSPIMLLSPPPPLPVYSIFPTLLKGPAQGKERGEGAAILAADWREAADSSSLPPRSTMWCKHPHSCSRQVSHWMHCLDREHLKDPTKPNTFSWLAGLLHLGNFWCQASSPLPCILKQYSARKAFTSCYECVHCLPRICSNYDCVVL